MAINSQAEYFVSRSEDLDGKTLSIFYAPAGGSLVVPKEVLRARSTESHVSKALWKLISGEIEKGPDQPVIEPSSIDQVERNIDEFLRTQPADELIVDEQAPKELSEALKHIQDALTMDANRLLANKFGLILPDMAAADDRPMPGQYL